MSNPVLTHAQNHGAVSARLRPRKGVEKKFLRFCPYNPLKRPDSDERNKGKPTKVSTPLRAFSQRNGHAPRRSKSSARTDFEGRPPRRRLTRLHPDAERPSRALSC